MTLKELFEQRVAIEAGCPQVRRNESDRFDKEAKDLLDDPWGHDPSPDVVRGVASALRRAATEGFERGRLQGQAAIAPEDATGCFIVSSDDEAEFRTILEPVRWYGRIPPIVVDPRLMKGTWYMASEAVANQILRELRPDNSADPENILRGGAG